MMRLRFICAVFISAVMILLAASPLQAQHANSSHTPLNIRLVAMLKKNGFINALSAGAVCNGTTDDTSAIQAALSAQTAYNIQVGTNVSTTVVLPDGTCRITQTLTMGLYGSLVGNNNATTLYADYSSWHGNNYDALDITTNTQIPSQEAIATRKIADFSFIGRNNSKVVSTAINVYSTSPTAGAEISDQIPYLLFSHLLVSGFDTGIEMNDVVATTVDAVGISQVRTGVLLAGNVVNTNLSHLQVQYSTGSYTSNSKSATTGIIITSKTYSNGVDYPQGIIISDSDVVGFDNDLTVNYCENCNFHDNIFDYGGEGTLKNGTTVWLGLVYGTALRNNYIANNYADAFGVNLVGPPEISQSSNNDGIWIEGNFITCYASSPGMIGVALGAGSYPSRGVHIENNHFVNVLQGIELSHPLQFSSIRGNYGDKVTQWLINLDGSVNPISHVGLLIQGNYDSDSIPVVNVGNASGYELEWNYSPLQTTPSK